MRGLARIRTSRLQALFAVVLVPPLAVHLITADSSGRSAVPVSAGVVGSNGVARSLPPGQVGTYVPGSSVLALPDGRYLLPDRAVGWAAAAPLVAESRAWLAAGVVPGRTAAERQLAERALLDLRALTTGGGGVVAAWHQHWDYVWPRDASWAAAAYCLTGHFSEGVATLRFLAGVQRTDGRWEARYRLDGTPVRDGRPVQLDGNGWVLWASWLCYQASAASSTGSPVRAEIAALWPMISRAADAGTSALRAAGLPAPTPDYWETRTTQVTLGVVAPLRAGLRAAAELAGQLGHPAAETRYRAAAGRLHRAMVAGWSRSGYRRTAQLMSGYDAAVAFAAPPFAPYDSAVAAAVRAAEPALRVGIGGIRPGERWPLDRSEAWTPETAFFALMEASSGHSAAARTDLGWLAAHRTRLGALPERVSASGQPVSVAPLSWTCAAVLLTLVALEDPLPIPPA